MREKKKSQSYFLSLYSPQNQHQPRHWSSIPLANLVAPPSFHLIDSPRLQLLAISLPDCAKTLRAVFYLPTRPFPSTLCNKRPLRVLNSLLSLHLPPSLPTLPKMASSITSMTSGALPAPTRIAREASLRAPSSGLVANRLLALVPTTSTRDFAG